MHEIHSINPTEKIPNLPERNALGQPKKQGLEKVLIRLFLMPMETIAWKS